ncbi:integrase arm-type DNA-binding domain-containing protein [Delftia tsuruhatensis]|uniref:Integrase n=1 Tax=Delftia tsuruhatensis TaxID=180282 RepID=A0ABN4SG41_9BURK|nr:site-specific integrase [Delftia tsuruhatensis]AOV02446.1 integrase [Delftia tsuruhatensis]MDH2234008.1 integrase arm-type DNA-binding domain-containing protein [Delftia tsuruhatensis]
MPKFAKELTAAAVAKLREPGRYPVGGAAGLHLRITDSGARLWVHRIMVDGKRRDIGLGRLEDVSLSQARDAARDKSRMVRQGLDPLPAPQLAPVAKVVRTFRATAEEYVESKRDGWRNEKHRAQWTATLEAYAYPEIGEKDVGEIGIDDVLRVLRPIWSSKTETATRLRGRIESVLGYAAVRDGRSGINPASWRGVLDKILPAPDKVRTREHHPAMPIAEAPAFMLALEEVGGMSALALRFLILTAARSGEVRGASWSEVDLQAGIWAVPAERMKAGAAHRVPLSTQALALLQGLPRFAGSELLFPSPRGGQLADMAMTALMRRRGLAYVPHGFRSTFRDWAGDHTEYPREIVEAALAHAVGNRVEAAYRRKDALERRRPLMQDWADFLAPTPHVATEAGQTPATP